METSPLPQEPETLSFAEVIIEATSGKSIRRQNWPEEEFGYFKSFADGDFLCIMKDGEEHIWKLSKGDCGETDWVIL